MSGMREWLRRLADTVRPRRRDEELAAELRAHVDLAAERGERVTNDMATFAGVGSVLLMSGLLAGLLPAWRASRLDPVMVLRSE